MRDVFDFDDYNLLISALVTIGMQGSFFIVAATCKFDKVTDFAGGSNFLVLALLSFFLNNPIRSFLQDLVENQFDATRLFFLFCEEIMKRWIPSTSICVTAYQKRQIAMTVLVVCWSLRLTGYLFYRILKIGEDKRFDDKRENILKFAVFWIFQAVWVFTVSLPVLFINAVVLPDELVASDYVGIGLFAVGLIIETIADQQKFSFRNDPDNKGKWCDKGLWSWSRHPNYFGEMLVWWGAFVLCVEVARYNDQLWCAVLSPVFLMAILFFLSGIPLLEKKADERHGRIEEYRQYKATTSPLVLLPPCIYGKLHNVLKAVFCFEFPLYSNIATDDTDYGHIDP